MKDGKNVTSKPHFIKCGPIPEIRDWRKIHASELTRAEKNMAFCERLLNMPTASGKIIPIRFIYEQEMFFYAVFDNENGTRQAIYSLARRNGKSFLVACILLCFLIGPEAKLNAKLASGAMSREQAAIIFQQCREIIAVSPKIERLISIVPSGKILRGLSLNTEYRSLSSESSTALGFSFALVLLDEVGSIVGPTSSFVSALISSQGSHSNPLMIFLSTQAPTDNDFFSRLIDDAELSQNEHTVCHVHAAPENCDLLDKEAWKMANPGLGIFRSEKDLEEQLKQAQRMPSMENESRLYLLNQRISADSPFISRSTWESNGEKPKSLKGEKVFGGLDLSAVSDLTGLVLVGEDGDVETLTWLPEEGIIEKSKNDRVPYDVWAKQGYLTLTPGKSIRYEWVARELRRVFDTYDVQQINFDRYNMKFLKPWLEQEKFTAAELEKFNDFGQGYISMSPALRSLETSLLSNELKHGNHPILTMCIGNCVVEMDAAGNRKFTKKKSTGRIDLAVCLAMAEDARSAAKEKTKSGEWSIHFV